VGNMSSEIGTPAEVAKAESLHAGRAGAVSLASGSTVAPTPSQSLTQTLDTVAAVASVAADELIGVKAVVAAQPQSITVKPSNYVTDDVDAFAAYTAAIAPAKAAATAAYESLDAAYAKNDAVAIENAYTALDNIADTMRSVAQDHFGVSVTTVSLSGTSGKTGSGTTVGGTAGINNNQANTPGAGTVTNTTANNNYAYDTRTATFTGHTNVSNDSSEAFGRSRSYSCRCVS